MVPTSISEEPLAGESPVHLARRLALAKAEAASDRLTRNLAGQPPTNVLVIGADTVVAFQGRSVGKPANAGEAIRILHELRGKQHRVITGIAVVEPRTGRKLVRTEVTRVRLRRLTDEEIAAYVATGDPLDKAGAYAIQNEQVQPVEAIDGCYTNVVGLPLCTLGDVLNRFGVRVSTSYRAADRSCTCGSLR